MSAKVLVMVSGGVAETVESGDVEVGLLDFDNYEQEGELERAAMRDEAIEKFGDLLPASVIEDFRNDAENDPTVFAALLKA